MLSRDYSNMKWFVAVETKIKLIYTNLPHKTSCHSHRVIEYSNALEAHGNNALKVESLFSQSVTVCLRPIYLN